MTKLCKDCKHAYTVAENNYRRCMKAAASGHADGSLCGEMRKVECGPAATLFEKKP